MNLMSIDLGRVGPDSGEFYEVPGKQHYRLLAHLSTQTNNAVIIDAGTQSGLAALALAYNPTNMVYSFDKDDACMKKAPNAVYFLEDLWDADVRRMRTDLLRMAAFIFLSSEHGERDMEMYHFLKSIAFSGTLVCDNVWYSKSMRDNFWLRLPAEETYDLTEAGHYTGTGLVAFGNQTFPRRDVSNWTLVTAYFDVTVCPEATPEILARPLTYYLAHAAFTMTVPYHLVVYCDAAALPELRRMRPAHLSTRYVVMNFEDFQISGRSFTSWREKIVENRVTHPYVFDPRNTASTYLLGMARYRMLQDTIRDNVFQSTHFAWITLDVERMGFSNAASLHAALACQRDKFSCCYIDYVPESVVRNRDEYFAFGRCGMCSGFITGNTRYMADVCGKLLQAFVEYAMEGYGHSDEQLYTPVYYANAQLFEPYYGDYRQMITNYARVKEAPEAPIRNVIANSFRHGDYVRCRAACVSVWKELVECDVSAAKDLCFYKMMCDRHLDAVDEGGGGK